MHTPLEGPLLVPNHPAFPLPGNTNMADLGFPPPSHRHINRRVPRRNDELPKSQPGLTDFLEVLRKKHAFDAASVSVGMIWSVGIFVMESTSSDPIPGAGRRPILNNDLTGCGNLTGDDNRRRGVRCAIDARFFASFGPIPHLVS